MKVLLAGDISPPSRCWQRARAFHSLGHEVRAVSTVGKAAPLIDRLLWRLRIARDTARANSQLLTNAAEFDPDLIWIDKGNAIRSSTLRHLKVLCPRCLLVSFSEDDMFAGHNRSRSYAAGLANYDLVITTKSYNCHADELPALGAREVVLWDNTFDELLHHPVTVSERDKLALGSDVGFIGTFETARADSLLWLARNGVRVKVRGNGGWQALAGRHPNLDAANEEVVGDEYVKTLCSTKINLGFLRKINRDLQTARSVEIPACGAFMLAERTIEHERLFKEGFEAEFFSSDQELLAKVRYYLPRENERASIALNGRERCVRSGYSIQCRLRHWLEQSQPLMGRSSSQG